MQRAVRWLIATMVALVALFGVWWSAALWGLGQEAAIALATAVSAIAAAPFVYWATRTISDTDLTSISDQQGLDNRFVTRRSAFLGTLTTGALGLAVGVVVALFAGSATNVLVWVGPGGPYPSSALPGAGDGPVLSSPPINYLTDLEPLPESDSVFSQPQTIGSESFTKALYGATGCSDVTTLTYRLEGQYVEFKAMAGPSGNSRSGNSAVYTIYVDSTPVRSFQVFTGDIREIENVDVTGASRLRITWEDGNTGRCFDGQETVAVIGSPRLIGKPS